MKAGFWVAPEGDDAAMTIMPIDTEVPVAARKLNFLATATAEEMIRRCRDTAVLLPKIADALEAQRDGEAGKLFDITDFSDEDRALITETLGEGEVSGVAVLANGVTAQIQEALMAGVWRIRFTDAADRIVADYVEIAAIPAVVSEACAALPNAIQYGEPPAGTMNVMPVLHEISGKMATHRAGDKAHTITFSLLPMSPQDMELLQDTLGSGPVQLTSRGYGTCRILATGARNVWSVQFYNSMDAIILDTLEICSIPSVAVAAEDDFRDSASRIREIEEAYFK
ncbi:hydrogenase expression/formation protein [Rhizobium sp. L1K21]|uniref:hydrogenase expression/formation protein n=1 Tax=Rhizobium sp. L1K21 TaxID=2954933 RepID=UPI002093DAD0|nr:hydrogenase expression/formation protein [Rhizobium sp. L1K21]MCO6184612.1 hydrogenase expression/formation protein [Rhizobium sp. L1K21]